MNRATQAFFIGLGSLLIAANSGVAAIGALTYKRVFVEPGRLSSDSHLRFLGTLSGASPRPLPLTPEQFEQLPRIAGQRLAAGGAVTVPGAIVIGEQRDRAVATMITAKFADLAGLRLASGQPASALKTEPPACIGSPAIATKIAAARSSTGFVNLKTAFGDCAYVGAAHPADLRFWLPETAVLMIVSESYFFERLRAEAKDNVVDVLVKSSGSMDDRELKAILTPLGSAIVQSRVPQYLFPDTILASARTAGIASVLGVVVALLGALVLALMDFGVSIPSLRIRIAVGASPRHVFVESIRRSMPYCFGLIPLIAFLAFAVLSLLATDLGWLTALQLALTASLLGVGFFVTATALARTLWVAWNVRRPSSLQLRNIPVRPLVLSWALLQVIGAASVVCALAYVRSYSQYVAPDLGMRLDGVTIVEMQLTGRSDPAARADALRQLLDRAKKMGGVQAASLSVGNPVNASRWRTTIAIQDLIEVMNGDQPDPTRPRAPGSQVVGPAYVSAMGGRVAEGRDFSIDDGIGARRVALVNQSAKRMYFGSQPVIGAHLKLRPGSDTREDWAEIVGVVEDIQHEGYRGEKRPEVYVSILRENVGRIATFFLVLRGNIGDQVGQLQGNGITIVGATSLRNEARKSVATLWVATRLLSTIAILGFISQLAAALLAAVAYLRVHSREVGIRMALGEGRGGLVAWLLRRNATAILVPGAVGLIVGFLVVSLVTTFDSDVLQPGIASYLWTLAFALVVSVGGSSIAATTWLKQSVSRLLRD